MVYWTRSQETWVLDSVAVKQGVTLRDANDKYNHLVEVVNTWALWLQTLPRNGRKKEKCGRV